MAQFVEDRLLMATNGVRQGIGPEDADTRARHESLVASDYDRCHPGDSFEAMKLRARFSKEDQGLLKEWMALAAARAAILRAPQDPGEANRAAA